MTTPARFTAEFLEPFRQQSDPVADLVVARIFERHDLDAVNRVFTGLILNDQIPSDLPPEALEYFEHSPTLPKTVEPELIALGQRVFTKVGPTVFTVLFCKALPECYACWRGAEVLYRTGRLVVKEDGPRAPEFRIYARRLMETAQFVTDVLVEGGLEPGGRGVATARQVRLIHAAIRRFLLAGDWDREKFGVPINFEDEAGTLMAFSIAVLEGLETLGVELSLEEQEGYYAVWRVIGHLMGLPPELVPDDTAGARELMTAILAHQVGPSEAGRVLTRSCVDFMNYLTPGNLLDSYPPALMRQLVPPDVASAVGLDVAASEAASAEVMGPGAVDTGANSTYPDTSAVDRALLHLYRFYNHEMEELENHSARVRAASRYFDKHLLSGIFRHVSHWKQIRFYIPPSLHASWGLEP